MIQQTLLPAGWYAAAGDTGRFLLKPADGREARGQLLRAYYLASPDDHIFGLKLYKNE